MKASHIHQFVDNKIRAAYQKNKSIDDVIDDLKGRISDPMRHHNNFKAYIAIISGKRLKDIELVKDKVTYENKDSVLWVGKLIGLLKLRDKLQGFTDFEIKMSDKKILINE